MQTTLAAHEQAHRVPSPAVAGTPHKGQLPPLTSGDRLARGEFERRYEAHPEIKKAELIEGVVYVASPVCLSHGEPHSWVNLWLGVYCVATPGLRMADNNSLQLAPDNEVQPDVCLWVDERVDGNVRSTARGLLYGSPELIVEVAASSAANDLHDKLHVYRRNGVREYLVLLAYERETRWYRLQDEQYQPLVAEGDGTLRSQVFPGLWFASDRFWAGDLAGLLAVLQTGLASPEHAAFVATLQAAQAG